MKSQVSVNLRLFLFSSGWVKSKAYSNLNEISWKRWVLLLRQSQTRNFIFIVLPSSKQPQRVPELTIANYFFDLFLLAWQVAESILQIRKLSFWPKQQLSQCRQLEWFIEIVRFSSFTSDFMYSWIRSIENSICNWIAFLRHIVTVIREKFTISLSSQKFRKFLSQLLRFISHFSLDRNHPKLFRESWIQRRSAAAEIVL